MFTVYYKSSKNYFVSHPQASNPYVRSRSFRSEAEAREFAQSVETKRIVSPIGKTIG